MIIAVTGGIASGKSSGCKFLEGILNTVHGVQSFRFSCDESVSELLTQADIAAKLSSSVSLDFLNEDGTINRAVLRDAIFSSTSTRSKVEEVLHPHVLERVSIFINRRESEGVLLIEVPLLYEVDFPIKRKLDLVIGSSRQTQISRMVSKRGLDQELAAQIIESQLPINKKIDRADVVIWNDGSLNSFENQLTRFAKNLIGNDKG